MGRLSVLRFPAPKPAKYTRRPRGQHNLYLRGGVWWTRICGVRESTGLKEKEAAAAKVIRDDRLRAVAMRAAGVKVEEPLPRLTLTQLIDRYLDAESIPYDRERGGEQAGTKRSSHTDRFSRVRILRHLDGKVLASDVTEETIIKLAEAIAREPKPPSKVTRKKNLAFLRRVFSWAAERPSESGIRFSPFARLSRQQRRELFPKGTKRAYLFTPDQLQALYAQAGWRRPLIRFAVHTGMRLEELLTLRWGCVNLGRRVAIVAAENAKNGREREVPIGEVALGVLRSIKPETTVPDLLVFSKPDGSRIGSVRTWWNSAVAEIWTPSKPSERRPRFHDLRKTCGTRVESVSSKGVAKFVLGHADEDVTDGYVVVTVEAAARALDQAAPLIDGPSDTTSGTVSGNTI